MANEERNILKLLIENQEKIFSIRQISILRKINYKTAYQNINKLKKQQIITLKKHGNSYLCSFNRNFNELVYSVESERREELLKNKNFKVLYDHLKAVNEQFILILFGSYPKNNAIKQSDIDLLLITDSPKKIESEIRLLPLKIHLTAIAYKEFIQMLQSKEFTLVSEAIKKNIILFGIPDYYRLIKNAI